MGLLNFFKKKNLDNSSDFKNSEECKSLLAHIEQHNKDLEVVKEEYFDGEGKEYKYYFNETQVRAQGYYYYLGYDKKGNVVDEKFQGKNVEYYENGQIKEIVYYKDGRTTGEYYYYDKNGNLL